MAWLWLTLGAQWLFSVGAHVDKYLLSKYFKDAPPGSLILFSALFGVVMLPVFAAIRPAVLSISASHVLVLLAGGFLNITGVVLSLYAMQEDEASVVAPLFQMVPVFNYALAWIVLKETLSATQVGAALLVMAGAVAVSLDLSRPKIGIKRSVLVRMAAASFLLAVNAVLFKSVAVTEDFWISTFWSYASLAVAGVVLFATAAPWRAQFLTTLRVNRAPVIGLNVFNELLAVVGYVMITYATLLVPVAMVSVLSGFQPLMVFLIGVFLTLVAPRLGREDLSRRTVVQKLVAMAAMLVGTWLLVR